MTTKKDLVIAILATLCLTLTLFTILPTHSSSSTATLEYDPWLDYNDDGRISLQDLVALAQTYGTTGTPINKTQLLLDLLQKIDQLNTTIIEQQNTINLLNETVTILNGTQGLGKPDYDSGWQPIPVGNSILLTHNLDTTELFVYVIGRYDSGEVAILHQKYYGGDYSTLGDRGLFWAELYNTTIRVERGWTDIFWQYVRVMIWKIPQP